jgi:hypothetical protein
VLSMTVCHLRREPAVQQRNHKNRKGDFATANCDYYTLRRSEIYSVLGYCAAKSTSTITRYYVQAGNWFIQPRHRYNVCAILLTSGKDPFNESERKVRTRLLR